MARCCEVCETLNLTGLSRRRLRRFLIEDRVLALCAEHADVFRERRPATLTQVAALFREEQGRRSLLPRRAPVERRQFPMRPEGRRRSAGRRASDGS